MITVATRRTQSEKMFRFALAGQVPAEALTTADRELLVRMLVTAGWTDLAIATHTRMTLYTTARIRDRTGLRPVPAEQPVQRVLAGVV